MTWPGAAVRETSTSIAPRDRRTRASRPATPWPLSAGGLIAATVPRSTPSTSTLTPSSMMLIEIATCGSRSSST